MAINIRTTKDAKFYYGLIRFVEAEGKGEATAEWVKEMKRAVREYTHREEDRHYIRCDWDSAVAVIEVPCDTLEEAEEWFLAEEYMESPNSPYDCTGALFTHWHSIVRLGGRLVCFHSIGMDV